MASLLKGVLSFVSTAIIRRPVATAFGLIGACEVVSSAATRFFRWVPLEVADIVSLLVGNGTAILYYAHSDRTIRQLILTLCTTAWSLRLSAFLFIRTFRGFQDNRLDNMRSSVRGALTWCIAQTIWIFVTGLPIWIAMRPDTASMSPLTVSDLLGVLGFIVGWSFEAIADVQRAKFIKLRKLSENLTSATNTATTAKFCQSGLFKLCRFPNYFGEWLMWTSLSVVAFQTTTHWSRMLLPIVPCFLHQLFHKVSIRLALEKMKRRLNAEEFERWNQMPLFFPRFSMSK